MQWPLPGNGESRSSVRFKVALPRYRDDGRAPVIVFERVRFLAWLDAPLDTEKSDLPLEWVARGALDVRLNGHQMPVALTSVRDIKRQVRRILQCSEGAADRIVKELPVRWSLYGPNNQHLPINELPSAFRTQQLLSLSTSTTQEIALSELLRWQVRQIVMKSGDEQ